MPTVYNRRSKTTIPADAVPVGRPTKWGNPFKVGRDGARGECAAKYRTHLWRNPELLAALPELADCDLVCWCAPAACHADHLLAAAAWAKANPEALAARIEELGGVETITMADALAEAEAEADAETEAELAIERHFEDSSAWGDGSYLAETLAEEHLNPFSGVPDSIYNGGMYDAERCPEEAATL